MTPAERNELKDKMITSFSFSEVKDLCFSLGIDPDSVPGETKPDKIRELILMCERRGREDELIKAVNAQKEKLAKQIGAGNPGQNLAPDNPNKKITILFLAANPKDTPQLNLDQELRKVYEKLRSGSKPDNFVLEMDWPTRAETLVDVMLKYEPDIVHFSGHGNKKGSLLFLNESGESQLVTAGALNSLFSACKSVRCVVMNACYSDLHANSITQSVDCVVGMTRAVGDNAAINFASGFYRSLGEGLNVQEAFDLGNVQIMLDGGDEQKTPHLRTRKGVDANEVKFG